MSSTLLVKLIPICILLLIIQITLAVLSVKDILSRSNDKVRGNKIVWIIISIILSGGIGSIFYFIFGRRE